MTKPQIGRESFVIDMSLENKGKSHEQNLELVQKLLDMLPANVVVIDKDENVVAMSVFNRTPRLKNEGGPLKPVVSSFDDVLEGLPLDLGARSEIIQKIRHFLSKTVSSLSCNHPLDVWGTDELLIEASYSPAFPELIFIIFQSVLDEENRAALSHQARIHRAQEEERRRIARELHDGTSQHVAVAQIMLETLRTARNFEAIDQACLEIERALSTAQHQMRTLSYALHPPELASGGIVEGLATFIKGFARRSGLNVRFHNFVAQLRPSADLELALYRVTQEALVNVSKHAFAHHVDVRLRTAAKHIVLEVEDDGIGIPEDIAQSRRREAIGVGLSGMRERVEMLGGVFCVERRKSGTLIKASFPQRRKGDAAEEAFRARRYCFGQHRVPIRRSSLT